MLAPDLLDLLLKRPCGGLFPGSSRASQSRHVSSTGPAMRGAVAARLDKCVSMHTLRHSFATRLLNRNTDIRVIKVLLGRMILVERCAPGAAPRTIVAGSIDTS